MAVVEDLVLWLWMPPVHDAFVVTVQMVKLLISRPRWIVYGLLLLLLS